MMCGSGGGGFNVFTLQTKRNVLTMFINCVQIKIKSF